LPTDLGYSSWVLQDLDTGAILAAKDPHARERPASLIKLLLAQVVARELNPSTPVVGTQDDADQVGSRVGVGPGGQYTVGILLDGLLLDSGNDAAHALAIQLGGMATTVEKMNTLAAQLGALDTRTATPSGLDGPGMSTSAYDLSVIFRADMSTPLVAATVHTEQVPFPGYGTKPGFVVTNDNLLLRTYPGDLGGKNGYTTDAQQTYANAAERDGHRIALVMMRGTNHLAGKWQNARELMDYGFALEDAHAAPVGYLVAGGATPTPNNVAKQVPTTGHGGAQVATAPQTSMSTFGNVGLPLTILAALAMVLIAMLYLKRQRAKRARRVAAARVASAETVRVPIPAELRARWNARGTGNTNGALPVQAPPATAPTPAARQRPVNGANGVNGHPSTRRAPAPGTPRPAAQRPQRPAATPAPEWPTGPEWPR
jgi:D-alanyl-D-alanine carboxypeptidase (penicillin-binding protein 5/6)